MKKKVVFALIPLFLIVLAVGGFLFWKRGRTIRIQVVSWDEKEESFVLCDIKVKNYDDGYTDVFFIPEDEDAFLTEIKQHVGYLGVYNFPYLGKADNPSSFFYFNNGIFSVQKWNAGYLLTPCMTRYRSSDGEDFQYPSPGQWRPENSQGGNTMKTFDEFFGTYDEIMWFYGRFDEDTVACNPEEKTITVAVYDLRNNKICSDRKVVIDFANKVVDEVMEETEENE